MLAPLPACSDRRFIWCWRLRSQNLSVASWQPSDEPMHPPLVHPVLKPVQPATLYLDFLTHQIDQRLLPMDCRFVQCWRHCDQTLLSCASEPPDRPTVPTNGPSVHPMPSSSLLHLWHSSIDCWFIRCSRHCEQTLLSCASEPPDRPTVPTNGPSVHPMPSSSLLHLWHSSGASRRLSHPEISNFRMWIKRIIK
jgi:hypothetical protein